MATDDVPGNQAARTRLALTPAQCFAVAKALILVLSALFMLGTALSRSPVVDEPFHLVRGLGILQRGDARLSYNHPPLINALAAIPAAFVFDGNLSASRHWDEPDSTTLGRNYFRLFYPYARSQVVAARIGMICLALLLLVYVHRLARKHYGEPCALTALALLAFNPTFLAHASVNTNDLGASLFFILIVGETANVMEKRGPAALVRYALTLGAAAVVKYSLLPSIIVSMALVVVQASIGRGRFSGETSRRRFLEAGRQLAFVAAMILFIINAAYLFRDTGWSLETLASVPSTEKISWRMHHGPFGRLPEALVVPLPATYCLGLSAVEWHASHGHNTWFNGVISKTGTTHYFPVMLLVKTPVLVWLLLLVGAASWLRRPGRPGPLALSMLTLAGVYSAFLLTAKINIGVRHALPLVPCLCLLAGVSAGELWKRSEEWSRRARAALRVGAVVGGLAVVVVPVVHFPHYLGYFNAAIGTERGHRISIVGEDWGQDVGDVAEYARNEGINALLYDSYATGRSELEAAGIHVEGLACHADPEGPAYAVFHNAVYFRKPDCYPWIERAELVKVFNHHIQLFEIPESGLR